MISYGFESYSPIVLKSMRKHITPKQIDFAFKTTVKHKMTIQANFIFGDVAETKETSESTLEYWKRNCEGQVWLDFIQPYPGSQIYSHCINKGLIKNNLEFIRTGLGKFFINMTDNMSEEEFAELKRKISQLSQDYHRYIRPISKIKKGETHSVTVRCPFCKELNTYNHCKITNRLNYGFSVVCRSCYKRYQIVSLIQYIIYKRMRRVIGPYLNMRKSVRLLLLRKKTVSKK